MKYNLCPVCEKKGVSVSNKLFGVGLACKNCGETLTLEGYSSVFFGLLAFVFYHILSAVYDLHFLVKLAVIVPPLLIAIIYFVPVVEKSNKYSKRYWLFAIAALIISVPFLGMGLYLLLR